jgi:adenylate kinase family enzyme
LCCLCLFYLWKLFYSKPIPFYRSLKGSRIVIVGSTGAGKSTLAQLLANRLSLEYVNSDGLIWSDNWTPVSVADRLVRFTAAAEKEAWVLDASCLNLDNPKRLEHPVIAKRATTVIFLDLPWLVVFWRLFLRTVLRSWTQEALWGTNCHESFRMSFCSRDSILCWFFTSFLKHRRMWTSTEVDPRWNHATLIRLRLWRKCGDSWTRS